MLPAETFAPGPTSGAHLGEAKLHGAVAPFVAKQPVMGFSGLVALENGSYLAPTDNGYGTIERSSDFELRVYTLTPDFDAPTPTPQAARLRATSFVTLRDPRALVPFAVVNQFTKDRVLTGADFDIESMQRAPDGTLWLGDEYGPFVLHTSASGELLDAPMALPDFDAPVRDGVRDEVWSPENPASERTGALRVLNAFRARGERTGTARAPAVSPSETLASGALFDIPLLRAAGYSVILYTVNDPSVLATLVARGVSGVITDRPDLLRPLAPSLDVQGHRGARDLRPENTLPAMEAALDALASTLETDIGMTSDGVPVLSHDPVVSPATCRSTARASAVGTPIRAMTLAALQSGFVCDKIFRGPSQVADLARSPAAVAFARSHALATPYTMPSLGQLFTFVASYRAYYATGPGRAHPDAGRRAQNAETVRFSLEIKVVSADDAGGLTLAPEPFTQSVGRAAIDAGVARRTSLQSFDYRALLAAQDAFSEMQPVFLFGEPLPATGSPVLAGVPWPRAVSPGSSVAHATRAAHSGGFEGLGISTDGRTLYPMLEQALGGDDPKLLPIYEFDIASKRFTRRRAYYRLSPEATSASELVFVAPTRALVLERDGSQGAASVNGRGWKRIFTIELRGDGEEVAKALFVDLMDLAAPTTVAAGGMPGDVGLGPPFEMPFETIEGVAYLGGSRIAVINDNNFPFSVGRHVGQDRPDDTELVVIDGGRRVDIP